MAELREVLQEKNMLKGRVMELEEELEQLRPRNSENASDSAEEVIPATQISRFLIFTSYNFVFPCDQQQVLLLIGSLFIVSKLNFYLPYYFEL